MRLIFYCFLSLPRFYSDSSTWEVDRQFLWGKHLLITPVLDPVSQHKNFPEYTRIHIWTNTNAQTCMQNVLASRHRYSYAGHIEMQMQYT